MITPTGYAKRLALKDILRDLGEISTLVDAGSSGGFHLNWITADRKIGLDLLPPECQEGVDGVKCDIRFMPIGNNVCDCLMCLDVIEHIVEDKQVLREFQRVLTENGTLVLTTPNDSEFMPYKFLRSVMRVETPKMHCKFGHVRPGYSKGDLVQLIQSNGFEIVYYRSFSQPLIRILDTFYLYFLLFAIGKYIESSPENAHKIRGRGKLLRIIENAHDLLFRIIVAPTIRNNESSGKNGWIHLLVCKKISAKGMAQV